MVQQAYKKPIPIPQPESDFYWEKCKQHELWLRKCNTCNKTYFYPRDFCPLCHGKDVEWVRSSGKGTLYTYSIVHRSTPPFRDDTPYVIAIVELEDGTCMPTNLVQPEPDPENIQIGMPVEVVFEDITDTISLPKFRPV